MIPGSFPVLLAPASGGYVIEGSGLFDGSSGYLSRTPSGAGNDAVGTVSFICKRGPIGVPQHIISCGVAATRSQINFSDEGTGGRLEFATVEGGLQTKIQVETLRDFSAYYHFVVSWNTDDATAATRYRFYQNGVELTTFIMDTRAAAGVETVFNRAVVHEIGRYVGASAYFSGYLPHICMIDGLQLDPTSFGEVTTDGFWQINDASDLTFGTNGFLLEGGTAMAAGTDSSGNSNNFSKTGTITATNDSPTDDADNNYGDYSIMNPLATHASILSQGNLNVITAGGNFSNAVGSLGVSSGKWYFEYTQTTTGSPMVGVTARPDLFKTDYYHNVGREGYLYYSLSGIKALNGVQSAYGASWGNGDVIGVAIDYDADTLTFYKNNASQGTALTGLPATLYACHDSNSTNGHGGTFNFGATAFTYTPPTDHLAISTFNFTEPAVANYEDEYYIEAGISHSNGATTAVTLPKTVSGGAMTRIKRTDSTGDWYVFDTVRGPNKSRKWNAAEAEDTSTFSDQNLTGTTLTLPSALATGTYLVEVFYVGSYFQIQTVTGNASARTITWPSAMDSYGFSAFFPRTGASSGIAHHKNIGAQQILFCDNGSAAANRTNFSQAPNKTDFRTPASVGPDFNQNTIPYVCYGWANSGPYAFGSYEGNASTDGSMINVGGAASSFTAKDIDSAYNWWSWINLDPGYNANNTRIGAWDTTGAKVVDATHSLDMLSNGIKWRTGNISFNGAETYVYMAFGIQPIQGNGTDTSQGRAK